MIVSYTNTKLIDFLELNDMVMKVIEYVPHIIIKKLRIKLIYFGFDRYIVSRLINDFTRDFLPP